MQRNGIGAVIVESGPSLDYFTGVQWWRIGAADRRRSSRRDGDPIIVTPFFERPSIAESLDDPGRNPDLGRG